MARYIDRDKLIADGWHLTRSGKANKTLTIMSLADVPTADVVEVKHGKWNINCDGYYPYCSECGYEPERPGFHKDNRTPYCPNCGAKMHLEVESTTYCTDKKNHLCHCEDCHEEC